MLPSRPCVWGANAFLAVTLISESQGVVLLDAHRGRVHRSDDGGPATAGALLAAVIVATFGWQRWRRIWWSRRSPWLPVARRPWTASPMIAGAGPPAQRWKDRGVCGGGQLVQARPALRSAIASRRLARGVRAAAVASSVFRLSIRGSSLLPAAVDSPFAEVPPFGWTGVVALCAVS